MVLRLPFFRACPPHLESLRSLSLFSELSLRELSIIDALLHRRDFLAGEVIFDEGEIGHTLYILLEGEVTICRQGSADEGQLARLRPGEFFGELGLLGDSARTAQAVAASNCRVLVLFRDDFNDLMDSRLRVGHKIGRQLLRHLALRLKELGQAVGAYRHQ